MKQEDYAELKRLCRLDGRLRMRRRAMCEGKQAYPNFAAAERQSRYGHRNSLKPYRCEFCSKWHRGNPFGREVY